MRFITYGSFPEMNKNSRNSADIIPPYFISIRENVSYIYIYMSAHFTHFVK